MFNGCSLRYIDHGYKYSMEIFRLFNKVIFNIDGYIEDILAYGIQWYSRCHDGIDGYRLRYLSNIDVYKYGSTMSYVYIYIYMYIHMYIYI